MSAIITASENSINSLAAQAQQGSQEAWRTLFTSLIEERQSFIRRMAKHRITAQDLEEAFNDAVLDSVKRYDASRVFMPLLRTALKHNAVNAAVRNQRQERIDTSSIEVVLWQRNPFDYMRSDIDLRDFVRTLDKTLQTACAMLIDGYNMTDAARLLDIPDKRTLERRLRVAFSSYLGNMQ